MKKALDIPSPFALAALIGITAFIAVYMALAGNMGDSTIPAVKASTGHLSANYDPCGLEVVECEGETAMIRTITAYNVGDPSQTDSSPCIGATGENLCEALAHGEKIVATNELPLGSKVAIAGEVYTVKDRTSGRYQYRYDIAYPAEQYQEALEWGVRDLEVILIK